MTRILLDTSSTLTLIGGAPAPADLLTLALDHAPLLIAADGGADRARALGRTPAAILGDMDSLDKAETWQNSDVEMYQIDEQDTTDFEKCLYSINAPLMIGVGFLGGHIDHALAAMGALVRYGHKPVVLLDESSVVFHAGPDLRMSLPAGTRVSFFPMLPVTGLAMEGLEWPRHWPQDGLRFAPDGRLATSNEASGGAIRARFSGPGMLACLPLSALAAVIEAISSPAR